MRYLFILLLIFVMPIVYSQELNLDSPVVKNSSIEFNGGTYDGYLIELNAPQDMVEDAIKERFKLQGVKPKELKGFMVYRNVVMPLIDHEKAVDAFIKIERRSRKEKEQTIVYFIASLPGEIPEDKLKSGVAAKSTGTAVIGKGAAFLTGIIPDVRQGVYDKDIANKQSQLKKEEKKLEELVNDQADMDKKLKKLQSDMEYNKKARERQTSEVEKARNTLNDLLSKNPKGK